MSVFIVLLHDFPFILIIILSKGHLLLALLIIFKQPYSSKTENYRNLFHSIFFLLGSLSLIPLVDMENFVEDKRIIVGYISIGFLGGIFFFETLIFIKEIVSEIIEKILQIITFIKRNLDKKKNKI